MNHTDYRQRFFLEDSPVRGDVVSLKDAYQTIIAQKPYPKALQALLGEMLVAASLLIGTLKIEGRLSIQLQSQDPSNALHWAMAECDSTGAVRALADFSDDERWGDCHNSKDAFAQLGTGTQGVLFVSIHQATGESYQGIVERICDDLGECLAHYQKQSAQIPTFIKLSCDEQVAGGFLVQLLPQSDIDKENDPDLWNRVVILANTLKDEELTTLPADELLYRLYHEEQVTIPEATPLHFGCTCSLEKSQGAIVQLGKQEALHVLAEKGELALDCGFCGTVYRFDKDDIEKLFDV